mgnify:CR=1 FL=1
MPTELAHVTAARTKAQAAPLAAAVVHLENLIHAIKWCEDQDGTAPTMRIKTEESAAVADVLRAMVDKPAPVVPVFLAVYIGTTNDVNGNPRRGWYVSRLDGQEVARSKVGKLGETQPAFTAWVEEGYNGTSAPVDAVARVLGMPTKTWNDIAAVRALVHETGRINVTPGEYPDARKLPRFGGAS